MPSERLKELLPEIISEPYETRRVEYKGPMSWSQASNHIAHAALGLVNTRDGGFVVVGVAEEKGSLIAKGLSKAEAATFIPDDVSAYINRFGTEPIESRVDVVPLDIKGQQLEFAVVEVNQFKTKPVFAKRDTDDKKVKQGVLYARAIGGKPETRQATQQEHEEILQLAVELRLRQFVETTRRAGLELRWADVDSAFAVERGDL